MNVSFFCIALVSIFIFLYLLYIKIVSNNTWVKLASVSVFDPFIPPTTLSHPHWTIYGCLLNPDLFIIPLCHSLFFLSANSFALLFTKPNNTLQCFHHQQSVFPWHCSDFFFLLQQIHFSSSFSSSHTDLCWTKHIWEDGSLALFSTEHRRPFNQQRVCTEQALVSCWALGVTSNITNNVFYIMNKYGRKGCSFMLFILSATFELEHSRMQEWPNNMHHEVTCFLLQSSKTIFFKNIWTDKHLQTPHSLWFLLVSTLAFKKSKTWKGIK